MTYLAQVLAGSEIPDGDVFSEALDLWVYRSSPHALESLLKSQPELFKDLPKAEAVKDLYRAIKVSKADAAKLKAGKSLKPIKVGLESWSTTLEGTDYFATPNKGDVSIILKKTVKLADRILYVPGLKDSPVIRDDDDRIENEQEVICRTSEIHPSDVFKILKKGNAA